MDLSNTVIETERLRLVTVREEDVVDIHREYRLPLTKYMNHTSTGTMEELVERHKKWRKEIKEGVRLFMTVLRKEDGEFLGGFALQNLDTRVPEMGGWLKQSAHGNKYGQEAAAALKQWADEHLEYDHILWPCAAANTGSRKVAELLGGVIKKEGNKKMASGETWPYVDYWIYPN